MAANSATTANIVRKLNCDKLEEWDGGMQNSFYKRILRGADIPVCQARQARCRPHGITGL
jgi:hypothetical protein